MRRFFKVRKSKMPNAERKIQIDSVIEKLISQNEIISSPTFDIIKFLKENEDFAIASQPMVDDTTGMLFVDDENYVSDTDKHKLIVINSLLQTQPDFVQRRRFIIAHEYAHYKLHKNNTKQYAHRDNSNRDAAEEKEADYFARCLLMPRKSVESFLNIDFIKDVSLDVKVALISRIFNVTRKKAKQRLEEDLCYGG